MVVQRVFLGPKALGGQARAPIARGKGLDILDDKARGALFGRCAAVQVVATSRNRGAVGRTSRTTVYKLKHDLEATQ